MAAANPLATQAGAEMLRAGGSALDAAVAVQMALTLVEPQSSGIGGGALLLHWDGRSLEAHDGRETAPAAADERLFLRPDGRPMPFAEVVVGGRAVGTPGALRMLHAAHARHGRLPWQRLFEPAIRLAREGFEISPRLHAMVADDAALRSDAQAARLYYDAAGRPWPVGTRLCNPALADVLQAIAERGADAFYPGIHVGVVDARGDPGLVTQRVAELGVDGFGAVQTLDRDDAGEPVVSALEAEMHRCHTASRDEAWRL